jgi:hypothetical protein
MGLTSVPAEAVPMPLTSSAFPADIESGAVSYGCERSKSFFNLRPGTWQAKVTGVVNGTCNRQVTAGNDTQVRIQNNQC